MSISASIRFITIFLLSFDLSLSYKLQLIDLITVSEYVFFAGKEETNGWKILSDSA